MAAKLTNSAVFSPV